jgi:hypothetical protein
MGRPTILNDDLIADICDYLRVGNYIEVATMACGVSVSAYQKWVTKGIEAIEKGTEAEGNVYVRFVLATQEAHAKAEAEMVKSLYDKWQVNKCWILERTRRGRYSRNDKVEVKQTLTATLDVSGNVPEGYKNWLDNSDRKQLD